MTVAKFMKWRRCFVLTGLSTGPCGVRPVNVAEKGTASVLDRMLAHGGDRTHWLCVRSRMTYGDARRRSWLERIELWIMFGHDFATLDAY
jgi:hypothetical protein